MWFKEFKEKALNFANKTISSAAWKLAKSSLVIKNIEDLEKFIEKSENTSFISKETWEKKVFTKHVIVIFSWKDENIYKEMLAFIPVLETKVFASNTSLKLCDLDLKDLKKYNIKSLPAVALFTNKKLEKVIYEKESIKKLVKSLDLDIIKTIQNI